jgi:quercetin dioxygenase-like cupin family protein
MFYKKSTDGYINPLKGIEQKTLVYGERSLLTEFRLAADCIVPRHSHPYEQTGYMIKGKMRLTIGSERFDVEAGDSWSVPLNEEHGVEVQEDALVVEVFSPVREDYLPNP